MMNMRNVGSKERLGAKFKDGICVELCLKLWFESDWDFCNIADWLVLKVTVQKENSKQSFLKVSLKKHLSISTMRNSEQLFLNN